jgi:Protein of unknown function (DUF1189)
MKRYGRIQGLLLALGSPSFYRDVAHNWGGIGILYVLLLFTLTWIPALVKAQIGFRNFIHNEFAKVAQDLPPITLQGGKASAPVPQPFTMNDPDTGKPVFVLDTTGEITSLDQTPAVLLLTQTRLHVRNQGKIEIHDLSQFPDVTISKEWIQEWLEAIGNWLAVGLFPLVMIGSLIRALIIMLLAALVGLIFNAAFNARLSYAALLRLAAVGMTLSVYLDTGLGLAGIQVPFWFILTLMLTTAYVAFGVKAASSDAPAQVAAADFYDEPRAAPPAWPSDAFRGER